MLDKETFIIYGSWITKNVVGVWVLWSKQSIRNVLLKVILHTNKSIGFCLFFKEIGKIMSRNISLLSQKHSELIIKISSAIYSLALYLMKGRVTDLTKGFWPVKFQENGRFY